MVWYKYGMTQKTRNPLASYFRASLGDAAMSSVTLPDFDFSALQETDTAAIKSRLHDFQLLRNMGHFNADKRNEFETMLRAAGQDEVVIQAHANHYALVSQTKADANTAMTDIEDGLNAAGAQIGRGVSAARQGLAALRKKLDL